MTVGITSFGGYVPRLRLQRAVVVQAHSWFAPGLRAHSKGERAICNWDEDAVTMAVEAARDCLTGLDRSSVKTVILASTSLPFVDRQNSVIVKEALNLEESLAAFDVTSSQRAGTSALIQAFAAAANGPVLVAGSEHRKTKPGSEAELQNGDAAAAFVVGDKDPIAVLKGSYSLSIDFVDHYRGAGEEYDYTWESRWIREEGYGKLVPKALKAGFATFPFKPADVTHFIMPTPFKGAAEVTAKGAGIPAEAVRDNLALVMGEAASAHPLVMLADVLQVAKPGDKIVVVGFGQGVDVLALEVTPAVTKLAPRIGIAGCLKNRVEEKQYTKFLFWTGNLPLEKGIRAEAEQQTAMSVLYRNRKSVMGLVGGRCTKTGTIQFPKTPFSVNPNDHAYNTQEDYPMADLPAKIMTYTADSLAFSPDPPLYFGTVLFAEGGRITVDFTDMSPKDAEVGAAMKMVFRIRAVDERRGFTKYFWKAAPAVGPA